MGPAWGPVFGPAWEPVQGQAHGHFAGQTCGIIGPFLEAAWPLARRLFGSGQRWPGAPFWAGPGGELGEPRRKPCSRRAVSARAPATRLRRARGPLLPARAGQENRCCLSMLSAQSPNFISRRWTGAFSCCEPAAGAVFVKAAAICSGAPLPAGEGRPLPADLLQALPGTKRTLSRPLSVSRAGRSDGEALQQCAS